MTTKTIDTDKMRAELEKAEQSHQGEEPSAKDQAQMMQAVQGALLTREQVAKLVPYELAYARDYTVRPYQWGYVLDQAGPLTADGSPLLEAIGAVTGMDLSAMAGKDASPDARISAFSVGGPTSVLLYGESLGTIVLAQTKTTPELQEQLKQARQASEILGSTTVNGAKALKVGTPLGGIIVWEQGDTTLIAGGMVPMSDLETFAGSVR